MKWFIIALFMLMLVVSSTGCSTTIGRFVTNVSSGVPGTVSIERCELRRNVWTGEFDVSNCETSPVGIGGQ